MVRYSSIKSHLHSFDLKNQRIFLRADLNVLSAEGKIKNDFRLQAILPTIDLILKKGGKIILATHIDRPKKYDANLSTKHLIAWFCKQGYEIDFAENPDQATIKSNESPSAIILLENLRFFAGEQTHDERFAQLLAASADYYVNDAFGLVHRKDTSITLLPELFPFDRRTVGLLIEKELTELHKLLDKPAQPFVLILGGAKLNTKIPLLRSLISLVDTIILCPAIVFTFLKAEGEAVGKSFVEDALLDEARKILDHAEKKKVKIVLPIDYQIAHNELDGPLSYIDTDSFSENDIGISIGPKTSDLFYNYIVSAQTLFFNGLPGFIDRPETLLGAQKIFSAIGDSKGYTVVGGGDTVAAAYKLKSTNHIDFLSTGGGATLAYLVGEKLPGLEVFIR